MKDLHSNKFKRFDVVCVSMHKKRQTPNPIHVANQSDDVFDKCTLSSTIVAKEENKTNQNTYSYPGMIDDWK